MDVQLEEYQKTMPLLNPHPMSYFNCLIDKCPHQIVVIDYFEQFTLKAYLACKKVKTISQGVFDYLTITLHKEQITQQPHKNNRNKHDEQITYENCLQNQMAINANSFNKFVTKKHQQEQKQHRFKYNQSVDFDKKVIELMIALSNSQNWHLIDKNNKLVVKTKQQEWQIPLKNSHIKNSKINLQKQTILFMKSQKYLNNLEDKVKNRKKSNKKQQLTFTAQQDENWVLGQLGQQVQRKVDRLEKHLQKSCHKISQILEELVDIKKDLNIYGHKMQIQENKFMKVLDDLSELRRQNEDHSVVSQKKKDQHNSQFTVPDFLREELSIDLHSSYLGKFDVSSSQITYKGQDKSATQLLSNKVFGTNNKNMRLKSSLKVIKTLSKCIKFGVIDNKYVNQRSCWNFPNIIYLHGWGHTMVSGHEQEHQFCDFGTGSVVEMQVDFELGFIRWMINNKTGVKLHTGPVRKLLRSGVIEWTPFIAMYNVMDCVEWSIKQ